VLEVSPCSLQKCLTDISVEKLEAARRELVELYLQIDVTKVWGNGSMVGADGTQFDFYEKNLLAGHHFGPMPGYVRRINTSPLTY
jgi:hypothetical protein